MTHEFVEGAPMIVQHHVGKSISVTTPGNRAPSWTLEYADRPKPYFHPVRTPSGKDLSLFEPHDHPWHRGLWFTIKYVNGVNSWEEVGEFGVQRVSGVPQISHPSADGVTVGMDIDWIEPAAGDVPIREHRTVDYRTTSDADTYDWTSTLTAIVDLDLDRTPFTTWGGYGGLSFRGTRGLQVDRFLLPDGPVEGRPTGTTGMWCDLSGKLDGGAGLTGGIAMFDHPENPRSPTPWYGGGGSGTFINAAFLFHEPMQVIAGRSLTFRYRVIVHDDIWGHDRMQAESARYVGESTQ